jgi:uncharacterized BrkB/YihY/UPF0761 family membrane protein
MSYGTRTLLGLFSTVVVGAALYVGAIMFVAGALGQAECDRGECSWAGELVLGESRYIGLAGCLFVAAVLVWIVSRRFRRTARRDPLGN